MERPGTKEEKNHTLTAEDYALILRESLTYHARFFGKWVVICLDAQITEQIDLAPLAHDMMDLHMSGINMAVVIGTSTVPKKQKDRQELAKKVLTQMSRLAIELRTVRPEFTDEGCRGQTIYGTSAVHGSINNGKAVFSHFARHALEDEISRRNHIILFPAIVTHDQQDYLIDWQELIFAIAKELPVVKVVYMTKGNGLYTSKHELLHQANEYQLRALIAEGAISGSAEELALSACRLMTEAKVPRVHAINGAEPNSLLLELMTKNGVGTMFHNNAYDAIRPASLRDIAGILEMMRRTMGACSQPEESIQNALSDFTVAVIDGQVIGSYQLTPYLDQKFGLLKSLCVDQAYQEQGLTVDLIWQLLHKSQKQGLETVYVIAKKDDESWISLGFESCNPDDLPEIIKSKGDLPGVKVFKIAVNKQ